MSPKKFQRSPKVLNSLFTKFLVQMLKQLKILLGILKMDMEALLNYSPQFSQECRSLWKAEAGKQELK